MHCGLWVQTADCRDGGVGNGRDDFLEEDLEQIRRALVTGQ